jgi:hypothetical protein
VGDPTLVWRVSVTLTLTRPSTQHRTGRITLWLAVFVGGAGAALAFSAPTLAAAPRPPTLTANRAVFVIPGGSTSTWTLKLWSHGNVEGSDSGTSGTLTVAVPFTSDCLFQADVSVTPVGGQSSWYSGVKATVPGCGGPLPETIAGDIYLCSGNGTQTTIEVGGGTLALSGPQALPSQPNPVAPMKVPSGAYTMTAGSPSGYVFVVCQGSASVGSTGVTASESVDVPAGGAGLGTFYVVLAAPVGSLSGGSGPTTPTPTPSSGSGPVTSPGTPGPVDTITHRSRPPSATKTGDSALAFTGLNTVPLLLAGLITLALGALTTEASRIRRRTATAKHATSRSGR